VKKLLLLTLLLVFFSGFSQDDKYNNLVLDRTTKARGFKGFSLGFLVQGQIKYPHPYYGPKVGGLYDDGAYHFTIDVYFKKFILGFQLSDEFLYLEKFDNGAAWKPRGFNGSYSSLTRAYWFNLGYNIINNINLKLGIGFRSGPKQPLTNRSFTASEVAENFDYENPLHIFNTSNSLNEFNEIDYSLSITYPIKVYDSFGIVPELGYTFKHAGLLTGFSIIYR